MIFEMQIIDYIWRCCCTRTKRGRMEICVLSPYCCWCAIECVRGDETGIRFHAGGENKWCVQIKWKYHEYTYYCRNRTKCDRTNVLAKRWDLVEEDTKHTQIQNQEVRIFLSSRLLYSIVEIKTKMTSNAWIYFRFFFIHDSTAFKGSVIIRTISLENSVRNNLILKGPPG